MLIQYLRHVSKALDVACASHTHIKGFRNMASLLALFMIYGDENRQRLLSRHKFIAINNEFAAKTLRCPEFLLLKLVHVVKQLPAILLWQPTGDRAP